ncbi:hypothetical protein K2173_024549 [Erythroxylum novogranatense]|uniref:Uncharacterized protein n=1 Tax=Erythroxylum novogranatense TaxID=1862640 RepID=A0AAV8SVF4_9ROSI|nr:hypothetical protein K2173_024549 [Erythroxylum novogranatense]
MASYRPFPPQSTFPPQPPPPPPSNQAPPPPPAQPVYSQQNYPQHYPPPPPHQQYPYQPPPPPPPPESSYPPPPPPPAPHQQYYPTSQYSQYGHQPAPPPPPPPPPPSSPPPSSSIPPPPPPTSPPPPPPKESGVDRDKGFSRERRDHGNFNHGVGSKRKPPPPQPVVQVAKKMNVPGRMETEEERRLRKKREFEKQRNEDKHRQQLKESQNSILQKTRMLSAQKGHGSIVGPRTGDRGVNPLLTADTENRLKKPTTFLCRMKFRNELPDPSAQPKFMKLKRDEDRFTRYTITSLEKMWKPQLYVEPDLGIPLDLLDLSVYNPPKGPRPPLASEDEELLRDDDVVTPVKKDGIRRKERPTDKGVSWLVKTQYISPLSADSAKQSLTEKQAKELREMKGGHNILENHNNRETQIKAIEESFEVSKLPPVHATNKGLQPVEIMPLLPDFDRYEDKFILAQFDGAPTVDSESYGKLDQSVREACEAQAVMKACVTSGSVSGKVEKFLAYMAPAPNELSKDIYDESEDILYTWVREYHWDAQGDDANDPTTYVVSFDETESRYLPLPTKITLKKKRATEGRSSHEVEHFPVPSRVVVRNMSTANTMEGPSRAKPNLKGHILKSRMGRLDYDNGLHNGHSSGAEDDMSE